MHCAVIAYRETCLPVVVTDSNCTIYSLLGLRKVKEKSESSTRCKDFQVFILPKNFGYSFSTANQIEQDAEAQLAQTSIDAKKIWVLLAKKIAAVSYVQRKRDSPNLVGQRRSKT